MKSNFPISEKYIELCRLLKAAGLVRSGGEAKEVIAAGLVKINGQTELRKRCKIHPGQKVEFAGCRIHVTRA